MGRHNSSRRRNYGRRQHEVKERRRGDWRLDAYEHESRFDVPGPRNPVRGTLGFLNPRLSLEGNG